MNLNSEQKAHFDQWAATYDDVVRHGEGFPFSGYAEVLDKIVSGAAATRDAHILDLGAGTGALTERFLERRCRVWGLDFSEGMLAKARARCPGARFLRTDLLSDWPSALPARFDAVVSAYVFHHFSLEEKLQMVARAVERTVPGGCVVIGDIAFPSAEVRRQAKVAWAADWDPTECYWAWSETQPLLTAAGLSAHYEQVSCCAGILRVKRRSRCSNPRRLSESDDF
jgi:putative AdoMet-dependent methyltransferase